MERKVKFFKAWIIFFIVGTSCHMLTSFLAGGVLGAILGFIYGGLGKELDLKPLQPIFAFVGFLVVLPISFICFKWSIRKFILPQITNSDPS